LVMPKHQNGDGERVDDRVEPNFRAGQRHKQDLTLRLTPEPTTVSIRWT
jgi:hypothetical protein